MLQTIKLLDSFEELKHFWHHYSYLYSNTSLVLKQRDRTYKLVDAGSAVERYYGPALLLCQKLLTEPLKISIFDGSYLNLFKNGQFKGLHPL